MVWLPCGDGGLVVETADRRWFSNRAVVLCRRSVVDDGFGLFVLDQRLEELSVIGVADLNDSRRESASGEHPVVYGGVLGSAEVFLRQFGVEDDKRFMVIFGDSPGGNSFGRSYRWRA